jgi:hypothetical protein
MWTTTIAGNEMMFSFENATRYVIALAGKPASRTWR